MIAVLGCGNMGQAIVKGFYCKDKSQSFLTYTPNGKQAMELAQAVEGKAIDSLKEIEAAERVILACKPQHFSTLSGSLKEAQVDLSNKHIISIMAAVPLQVIKDSLGALRVSRVMPNTPARVGEGMTLLIHSEEATSQDNNFVETFFQACGETVSLPTEEAFDKVTTVSGSGPAYVFQFASAMVKKLVAWGLDEKEAQKTVTQLFLGSSLLMKEELETPLSTLVDQVTSKKGVTIEAVETFRAKELDAIVSLALDHAAQRSLEMTEEVRNQLA